MSIIEYRYSVRRFNEQGIAIENVVKIIEAGMMAPSSKNKKPWQFVVLSEENLIHDFSVFHSNWTTLKGANKAILVCGDLNQDERERHVLMACSAASENILLKATELGIGSVWLGIYPDEARVNWVKEKLSMPKHILPIALIALGYSDEMKVKKRELNRDKIHFNKW